MRILKDSYEENFFNFIIMIEQGYEYLIVINLKSKFYCVCSKAVIRQTQVVYK